jgi:hypothetical protein
MLGSFLKKQKGGKWVTWLVGRKVRWLVGWLGRGAGWPGLPIAILYIYIRSLGLSIPIESPSQPSEQPGCPIEPARVLVPPDQLPWSQPPQEPPHACCVAHASAPPKLMGPTCDRTRDIYSPLTYPLANSNSFESRPAPSARAPSDGGGTA